MLETETEQRVVVAGNWMEGGWGVFPGRTGAVLQDEEKLGTWMVMVA